MTRSTDGGRVITYLHRVLNRMEKRGSWQLPLGKRLDQHPDLRGYQVGRYSWGHLTVSDRTPGTQLRIGQFCSLAYGCHVILGGEHRTDFVSTYRFPAYKPFKDNHAHLAPATVAAKGDVTIGNDVWIGHQTLILSGVEIGDGVVVGAGSVVRRNVPPYAILAGNPARVTGFRFDPDQIESLLRIRWWDWPVERIVDSMDLLMSADIQQFIDVCEKSARVENNVPGYHS